MRKLTKKMSHHAPHRVTSRLGKAWRSTMKHQYKTTFGGLMLLSALSGIIWHQLRR